MSASDFTTRGDVAAFLQASGIIVTGVQQDSVDRALREADGTIRNYTNQHISYVEDDTVTLDGGNHILFLTELPIVEVTEVVEGGTTLTETTDYIVGRHGMLYRVGRLWCHGIQNVSVTYSHGYATIPQIITDIATRAASRAYQAGLKSADGDGVPGVQAKSLGDFSVTYSADSSAAEGTMGASGFRILLQSEMMQLDKYRVLNRV